MRLRLSAWYPAIASTTKIALLIVTAAATAFWWWAMVNFVHSAHQKQPLMALTSWSSRQPQARRLRSRCPATRWLCWSTSRSGCLSGCSCRTFR